MTRTSVQDKRKMIRLIEENTDGIIDKWIDQVVCDIVLYQKWV